MRRIFGPKRDNMAGDWTTLHNLNSSPNIRMMKSRG
jgi:hypothetical protein